MANQLKAWINGEIIPWEEARVPLLSHGFSRGSAVFEVFGTHEGPDGVFAFRMDKHLDRLFRSAELLGMELGPSREEIEKGAARAVRENRMKRGLVKIMAYWSEEAVISLVLNSKLDVAIFAIPEFDDLNLDKTDPINVCISRWRKIRSDMVPSEAKACANYLNGLLARKDAVDRGFNLGILLTDEGYVAEGSIESVFMVKDGVVKTPPLGNILRSITRMSILEAADEYGLRISEEKITPEELMEADEIFTCHSGIKVLPVKRIEDHDLNPAPGPITLKIAEMMGNICSFRDERFSGWFQRL